MRIDNAQSVRPMYQAMSAQCTARPIEDRRCEATERAGESVDDRENSSGRIKRGLSRMPRWATMGAAARLHDSPCANVLSFFQTMIQRGFNIG